MPTSSLALYITAPSTSFSGAVAGDQRRRSSYIKYMFPHQLGTSKTSQVFLVPLPGRKKTSARVVSHAYPLLCFKFCFTLFLLVSSFYQKTQEKN
jgi:hypothetical protein